jgi:hypothetical protein
MSTATPGQLAQPSHSPRRTRPFSVDFWGLLAALAAAAGLVGTVALVGANHTPPPAIPAADVVQSRSVSAPVSDRPSVADTCGLAANCLVP